MRSCTAVVKGASPCPVRVEIKPCRSLNWTRFGDAGMRGKLPDWINLPPSVTVPFGAFEEALGAKANAQLRKELEAAVKSIPESHAEEALAACRNLVMQVRASMRKRLPVPVSSVL